MKHFLAWKGMKSAVQEFVQACVVCQ
jgi:hypothetical protein